MTEIKFEQVYVKDNEGNYYSFSDYESPLHGPVPKEKAIPMSKWIAEGFLARDNTLQIEVVK